MSGLDILSFILGLPSYIENFTKTCRTIRDYKELDNSHKVLMERAILNSQRLNHLASFLRDPSDYSMGTQTYISHLVLQARLAMDQTMTVVMEWKRRLGIQEYEPEPSCFGKKATKMEDSKPSYVRKRVAEAEYMITGKLVINSSMESLEHWLNDLNFAILTSNRLSVDPNDARGASVNIEFVAYAKNRVASEANINLIDSNILEPLSDVDSEMGTGIYSVDSGPYSGCIVDPRNVMQYTGKNKGDIAWEETRNIARLFAEDSNAADSSLSSSVGILPSCGYTELDAHLHAIIFRLPPDSAPPRTLRNLLVEGKVKHSLHDRVEIVHKNIKPDSILVSESVVGDSKKLYPYKLGIPYLLAFDSSRSSRGPTMREYYAAPNGALWETLYRHPRHFGYRQYNYEMRDDIFSLGICLLEIALWKSLFRWDSSSKGFDGNTDVLDLSDVRCRKEAQAQGKPKNTKRTWLRQYLLIEAAEEMVPVIMGDLFKDVVVACLTFGDASRMTRSEVFQPRIEVKSDFPPEEQSIHFVRDILTKLRSIRLS